MQHMQITTNQNNDNDLYDMSIEDEKENMLIDFMHETMNDNIENNENNGNNNINNDNDNDNDQIVYHSLNDDNNNNNSNILLNLRPQPMKSRPSNHGNLGEQQAFPTDDEDDDQLCVCVYGVCVCVCVCVCLFVCFVCAKV